MHRLNVNYEGCTTSFVQLVIADTGVSFTTREHFGPPAELEGAKNIRFADSGVGVPVIKTDSQREGEEGGQGLGRGLTDLRGLGALHRGGRFHQRVPAGVENGTHLFLLHMAHAAALPSMAPGVLLGVAVAVLLGVAVGEWHVKKQNSKTTWHPPHKPAFRPFQLHLLRSLDAISAYCH